MSDIPLGVSFGGFWLGFVFVGFVFLLLLFLCVCVFFSDYFDELLWFCLWPLKLKWILLVKAKWEEGADSTFVRGGCLSSSSSQF